MSPCSSKRSVQGEDRPDLIEETERSPLFNNGRAGNDVEVTNHRSIMVLVCLLIVTSFLVTGIANYIHPGIASINGGYEPKRDDEPLYYDDQLVDHNDDASLTYSQRYYENTSFFSGPGHPFFVIIGGEDPVERILYPFVSEHLAKQFSGYTLNLEHRFYGNSFPVEHPTNADLRRLLTPAQAMDDAVQLIRYKQEEFGCGPRGTDRYCPVITIGGSYAGFLAVLMRLVHSDAVDIGYGSSAPLLAWSHDQDHSGVYFDKITQVADEYFPGCADAVRETLSDIKETLSSSPQHKDMGYLASQVGVCRHSIPDYIDSNSVLAEELMVLAASHFAEGLMEFYPPSGKREFAQSCRIFQDDNASSVEKMSSFLRMRNAFHSCFDIQQEVPPGPHGAISNADWSGVGGDASGLMWDFQCCMLINESGFSQNSMFPPRPWTLEYLTDYCEQRFGYTPDPKALVNEFGFDTLTRTSRLILTNGMNDPWSTVSVTNTDDVSGGHDIVVINIPQGAHHSDLTHEGPSQADTPGVKEAHRRVTQLIGDWLQDVMQEDPKRL